MPEEAPPAQSIIRKEVRIPDDEGVVTSIDSKAVVLDGARKYLIDRGIESFTASGRLVTPLVHWKDRYVHVGVKARTAVWIAGIGIVAKTDPPRVYYGAEYLRTDSEGRAVFDDGTVLKVKAGVETPSQPKKVTVEIDPVEKVITRFN